MLFLHPPPRNLCISLVPSIPSQTHVESETRLSNTFHESKAAVAAVDCSKYFADFDQFTSLEFPAADDDGTAGIETVSLAVVKYWLPPVKSVTSSINLAVLAGKAYPELRGQNGRGMRTRGRACATTKVGPDCMAESKLLYIYDPPPERAQELPLTWIRETTEEQS